MRGARKCIVILVTQDNKQQTFFIKQTNKDEETDDMHILYTEQVSK